MTLSWRMDTQFEVCRTGSIQCTGETSVPLHQGAVRVSSSHAAGLTVIRGRNPSGTRLTRQRRERTDSTVFFGIALLQSATLAGRCASKYTLVRGLCLVVPCSGALESCVTPHQRGTPRACTSVKRRTSKLSLGTLPAVLQEPCTVFDLVLRHMDLPGVVEKRYVCPLEIRLRRRTLTPTARLWPVSGFRRPAGRHIKEDPPESDHTLEARV